MASAGQEENFCIEVPPSVSRESFFIYRDVKGNSRSTMFTSPVSSVWSLSVWNSYALINKLYTIKRWTGGRLHLVWGAVENTLSPVEADPNQTCWFDSAHVGNGTSAALLVLVALICPLHCLRWGHLSPSGGGIQGDTLKNVFFAALMALLKVVQIYSEPLK